jgi:mono/diheme cytochrome c family protein
LDQRFVVAGWKLLFLRRGTYRVDNSQSAEWNRGAYLVEGLAHCGACHTPRNALGAERTDASFSGGDVDNWHAYAINARSPSPVPWNTEALFRYLRQGFDQDHGVARGPMAEVVSNLSSVPESDVHAIAVYMTSVFGRPGQDHIRSANDVKTETNSPAAQPALSNAAGASIYAAACATCHETDRPLPYGGVNLGLSTALSAPDPRNAANIILSGIGPVAGERSPIMPGFADSMTDTEVAALLDYLRARFSKQGGWAGVEKTVADARRMQTVFLKTSPGPHNAPAEPTQRDRP